MVIHRLETNKLVSCLQSGCGIFCGYPQITQSLIWMHGYLHELCKLEYFIYEDYTRDFHIQTHIVVVNRHALINGWGKFVREKKRLAGDAYIFLRYRTQICIGVCRAVRLHSPPTDLPCTAMQHGILSNANLSIKAPYIILVNKLAWPEVARRYIMAYLLMGRRPCSAKNTDSNKSELIHCLLGDCGIFCSSHMKVAGIDLDAQLLGSAVNNVFGNMKRARSILSTDITGDGSDGSIPQWAKVLDPVPRLPTNVGTHEALEKNPPEWAKKQLEASILKDIYESNASGLTKRAVIDVLKRVVVDAPQRPLSLDVNEKRSCELLISKVIMKKFRSMNTAFLASWNLMRLKSFMGLCQGVIWIDCFMIHIVDLSLHIYTLDASLKYQTTVTTSEGQQSRKMKQCQKMLRNIRKQRKLKKR